MEFLIIRNYQLEDFINIMLTSGYTLEISKYDEDNVKIIAKEKENN